MNTKIAVVFPGGGVQYPGMGKSVYERSQAARDVFEAGSECLGYDVKAICFEKGLDTLSAMQQSQELIFVVSVATYKVFEQETDMRPHYMMGHSQGEYAAMFCSGMLDFKEAIQLVRIRGKLLEQVGQQTDGTMMAVKKCDLVTVQKACKNIRSQGGQVYVAVYNSPSQYVVSGVRKDIYKLATVLEAQGAVINVLNIATPSHSPLMEEVATQFQEVVYAASWKKPFCQVISNVTAKPYQQISEIPQLLVRHFTEPVLWYPSIRYVFNHQVSNIIDIGPQAVLKNLNGHIDPRIQAFSYYLAEDAQHIKTRFKPASEQINGFIQGCMAVSVATRHNNYTQVGQQIIHAAYQDLQKLYNGSNQTTGTALRAIELTHTILNTKGVAQDVQKQFLTGLIKRHALTTAFDLHFKN